ncbi:ABC transporter substrate-binding protein [Paracoccus sp. Z330]|uniref:ABC transporter substrate-binding protein n=1 Tax=Paracoccus onchidii TaxID=3017813 RepID=A0ABT4ZFF1_9RHOB|nr:ABC transporter substrate-binding protein [Paracoccus onchidii]MDB6178055.1 ABC transporter substrate-binding protein [Paracoccus onchidii]
MRYFSGAFCAFMGATALHAGPVTVETARGPVALEAGPLRVVTMDLAALDTISALGGDVVGVPNGIKPDYLSQYSGDGYAEIGTFFEPDIEAIAALEPDLIIVSGRSQAKYDELAGLAPTIDLTPDPTAVIDSIHRNTRTLGAIYGREAEAEAALADLDAQVADLHDLAEDAGTALTVLTTGGRMSTHGAEGRFAVLYDAFGFAPAVTDIKAGNHGQPISNEFIRSSDPDWIFVIDRDAAIGRDGQPAAQMLDNPLVNDTRAAQSGQILYLDPVDWYIVGASITAVENSVAQLSDALAQ